MELLWDGGTKVCSNVPGHMTKMAAMPFSSISCYDVETEEKSTIFKRVFRENQVCNHIFLLHHSVAGTRLKKIFSGTKRPVTLKLGMQDWVLEYYLVCSNDYPELTLTLTYFTARSNLVLYAFVGKR